MTVRESSRWHVTLGFFDVWERISVSIGMAACMVVPLGQWCRERRLVPSMVVAADPAGPPGTATVGTELRIYQCGIQANGCERMRSGVKIPVIQHV